MVVFNFGYYLIVLMALLSFLKLCLKMIDDCNDSCICERCILEIMKSAFGSEAWH